MQWGKNKHGFTIVELLIVVVVIAILAAVTIVGYNGIQNRAKDSSLMSDMKNASTAVKLALVNNPGALTQLPASVKASPGNSLVLTDHTGYDGQFCINGYSSSLAKVFSHRDNEGAVKGICPGQPLGAVIGDSLPNPLFNMDISSGPRDWKLRSGTGIRMSDDKNQLILTPNTTGSYQSALIRVTGSTSVTLKFNNYATLPASYYGTQQVSAGYTGALYFGSNGTTAVVNSTGTTSNGNARSYPLNEWSAYTNNYATGPNVHFVSLLIHSGIYTSDNIVKDIEIIINQ